MPVTDRGGRCPRGQITRCSSRPAPLPIAPAVAASARGFPPSRVRRTCEALDGGSLAVSYRRGGDRVVQAKCVCARGVPVKGGVPEMHVRASYWLRLLRAGSDFPPRLCKWGSTARSANLISLAQVTPTERGYAPRSTGPVGDPRSRAWRGAEDHDPVGMGC